MSLIINNNCNARYAEIRNILNGYFKHNRYDMECNTIIPDATAIEIRYVDFKPACQVIQDIMALIPGSYVSKIERFYSNRGKVDLYNRMISKIYEDEDLVMPDGTRLSNFIEGLFAVEDLSEYNNINEQAPFII